MLPPEQGEKIIKKIYHILSQAPFPHSKNPKKLIGTNIFRLRMGKYRIFYIIEKTLVTIIKISDRKDAYR